MSAMSDLDVRLQELAERYYNSLEDQLYDPDPEVDGYGKERQRQYILALLAGSGPRRSHPRRWAAPEGERTRNPSRILEVPHARLASHHGRACYIVPQNGTIHRVRVSLLIVLPGWQGYASSARCRCVG